MVQLQKINSVSDPAFATLFNLYCNAFPEKERRTWDGLEFEIAYQKQFYANAILNEGKLAGLFHFWALDGFYFVEHFAVLPTLRGQHIGTDVLDFFKSKASKPILLEVELANTPEAERRLNFYQKQGFVKINNNYIQPPYEQGGTPIPMLLLSNEPAYAELYFDYIKESLYEKVYHYEGFLYH